LDRRVRDRSRALCRGYRFHHPDADKGSGGAHLQDGRGDRSAHHVAESLWIEAAGALAKTAQRRKTPISVLAFDLDHFKSINDRFGHATGDAMLQLFASVVRTTMRADDIIGHLGGEEFVAFLPCPVSDAAAAAERVRVAFQAARNKGDRGHVPATVSIGVASGAPATKRWEDGCAYAYAE
jgi:diguanylate cyclase (GGDEF)-like protein